MIGADEPDHRRLRSLVDQAFQRQNIAQLRPRIGELTHQQLDRVRQIAARNGGQVDLIEHLARPVPLAVICELLGLPEEDRPKFKQWFSSFANIQSLGSIVKVVPGLRKTLNYLRGQFAQVRRQPGAGLITALVEAEHSGDRLSDDELQSMVMLLLLAGHETTVHLLSTSILTLLQLPEVKRTLLADWSAIDSAVDELLRYNSPAQFAKPRFVTQDVEFHGQRLRRGDMVMPILASANYDPTRFANPTEFIIDRPQNYHLGFGAGPHVCLGLKLARAETQVVLESLFTRWPDLQAGFELSAPDWSTRLGMRSLKSLTVRCD
jgi:cytochrome P450